MRDRKEKTPAHRTANHTKCGSSAIAKTCFCQHKLTSTGARGCLKIIEDNSTCHISTQLHANYTIFHNLIQASYALAKVGHEIKRLDLISNHFKWFHVLASSTTSCGLSSGGKCPREVHCTLCLWAMAEAFRFVWPSHHVAPSLHTCQGLSVCVWSEGLCPYVNGQPMTTCGAAASTENSKRG